MNYPSKLVEDAVEALASLPSIGKKSALRLVLHLLDNDPSFTEHITKALDNFRTQIKTCVVCHNLCDLERCSICANPVRNNGIVCVVESIKDVMAIEETNHFHGTYHVLGGVISPLEGVRVEDLNIDSLFQRIQSGEVKEVIMAISPTIDGETTMYYLGKKMENIDIRMSTIARGISFGGELEYADGFTLGRSIETRLPYDINQKQ